MEKDLQQEHELHLRDRGTLRLTGVKEIESFHETVIVLSTLRGLLIVRGEGLKLRTMTAEGGQVSVEGRIHSLVYEEEKTPGGFLRRWFS